MSNEAAEAAADIISDQLREQLEAAEVILTGVFDTTLARRDLDGSYIVELVRLRDNAIVREDGTPILRITVQALG